MIKALLALSLDRLVLMMSAAAFLIIQSFLHTRPGNEQRMVNIPRTAPGVEKMSSIPILRGLSPAPLRFGI